MKTAQKIKALSVCPYKNYLLVRKEIKEKTLSGLLLSAEAVQTASFGEVIGSGTELSGDIIKGDKLMFAEYSGFELERVAIAEIAGDDETLFSSGYSYHLISEDDVLMVVRREA